MDKKWYRENFGAYQPYDTSAFSPLHAPIAEKFRVEHLNSIIEDLRGKGFRVDHMEENDYGRFAWLYDPDGDKIELWEPPSTNSLINLPEAE